MTNKSKGSVIFITQKLTSILLIFIVTLSFFSCNNKVDSTITTPSDTTFSDYSFWEQDNQVRITLPLSTYITESDNNGITTIGELDLTDSYLKKAETLKSAMIDYFLDIYQIDISKKLENQKLKAFLATDVNEGVMGYVDVNEPDYLNLNSMLFTEYQDYFNNVYIHETLHQIGFRSSDGNTITEGIVDALTDLILQKAKIKSVSTASYNDIRTLGYQFIAADSGIAEFYLSNDNPSITNRVTRTLEKVQKPFLNIDEGTRLEALCSALTYGFSSSIDVFYFAFEAQEIVRSYCQTFNPNTKIIDYIRSYYLVESYENVIITSEGSKYHFFIN